MLEHANMLFLGMQNGSMENGLLISIQYAISNFNQYKFNI